MEGTSTFEANVEQANNPCQTSPNSLNNSNRSKLLENIQQFNYQPKKRPMDGANGDSALPAEGQLTNVLLQDVHKRWAQQVSENGPPAKTAKVEPEESDIGAATGDKKDADENGAEETTEAVPMAQRFVGTDCRKPFRSGQQKKLEQNRFASDDSDDDAKDAAKNKDADSNYEPSSTPTSDTGEEESEDEISDDRSSGEQYRPPRQKNAQKKPKPLRGILSFLASNCQDDGNDGPEEDDRSNDKEFFRAKNSFEMLRRLREKRMKKQITDEQDDSTGCSKFGSASPGSSCSASCSSTKCADVEVAVTEKTPIVRKRQVLLSEDEDDNGDNNNDSDSSVGATKSKVYTSKDSANKKKFSPQSPVKMKQLRKTVVYSSGESADEDDGSRPDSAAISEKASTTQEESSEEKPTLDDFQDKCVKFFNDASAEQFLIIPRCTARVAEAIVECRPFDSYDDLIEKVENLKVKGATTNIVSNYVEILDLQNNLDNLLTACQKLASGLENSVNDLMAQQTPAVSQPSLINKELSLKEYQIVGLNWLILMYRNGINAILADEMGLGKTVQVIAFLAHLKEQKVSGAHVVVVPSSTIDNWLSEFQRWCPELTVLTYYGSMEDRKFLRKEILTGRQTNFDVLLSTYRVITSSADDRAFFKRLNLLYAVFDEAHMLKSCNTARYKSLMKVKAKHRLLLTGTPLQNNLVELISLLYFVMPSLFRQHTDNLKDTLNLFQNKNGALGEYESEKIEQAKRIMKPFVLRRLKSEVLSQLPDKHERIEMCELTSEQMEIYGSLIGDYSSLFAKDQPSSSNEACGGPMDARSMFMQLRKAANHPLLIRTLYTEDTLRQMSKALLKEKTHREADPQTLYEDMCYMHDFQLHKMCRQYKSLNRFKLDTSVIEQSGKLIALDRILPEIKAQGNKVLLFSQFTMVLDVLEEYLKARKYKFLRLDGSTPVVERQLMIDKFNVTPNLFIFLLSTRAGGLGINLTSANTIILHDIDYNPYNDKQAEDRCHRVGQTKEVTVIRLIAKNTVDETMLSCAQKKLMLERQVTGPTQDDEEDSRDVEGLLKMALNM